jgi:cytochrome c peroxidase
MRQTHPQTTQPWLRWAFALLLLGATIASADNGNSPAHLRSFIDQQVGGLHKLTVPAKDEDLPQPRRADGSLDPFFQNTEAKRYLGKLLFHDPARMIRIRPQYGGIPQTAGSASCASCHLGETATKAGTLLNFAVSGEGRHYTDEQGNFIARRRVRSDLNLPKLRSTPLFPGDSLVDSLPTLTDIWRSNGQVFIGTPALGAHLPDPKELLATGRLDAVDSVGRNAPGVIGSAFNNRLLLFGLAGEAHDIPGGGGLNPFNHPAQENVTLLLLDAHRLLEDQPNFLRTVPVYRKLFRDAFPEEAAQSPGCVPQAAPAPGACDALINDLTVVRATATFLRTTVTRNTPWDRFLAGHNGALSHAQRRGAKLFFTPASQGGAGCYGCHSGPMLNKQTEDPDVAGVGAFVEQNFYNVGLGDHPLQALGRAARNDPNFHDFGRQEVTNKDTDKFKFRVLTLRQLKDARLFFHNGAFSNVRDVVQYFNAGIAQDATAADPAIGTLTWRFTHPRGNGSTNGPRGLGLSERQVDDLTDFLENGLYDPAFAKFDPKWPNTFFQLSPIDFTYSKYRPDLAALGAIDGRPPSGRPQDNDDALSRRDMGLEFLDVTSQAQISQSPSARQGERHAITYRITNNSTSIIDTHLLLVARGLPPHVKMLDASGTTSAGEPYRRVYLDGGVLMPGQSIVQTLAFTHRGPGQPGQVALTLLSGQGKP